MSMNQGAPGSLVALILAGLLAACETAPVTGRNQLILVPEDQAAEMGAQAFPPSSDRQTAAGQVIAERQPKQDQQPKEPGARKQAGQHGGAAHPHKKPYDEGRHGHGDGQNQGRLQPAKVELRQTHVSTEQRQQCRQDKAKDRAL